MKAYSVKYEYNNHVYSAVVDAKNKGSARNKIGRKHGLNAAESKKRIRLLSVSIIGYF